MTTTAVPAGPTSVPRPSRLLRRVLGSALVAVVANVLLATTLAAAVDASEEFLPLTAPSVAAATLVGLLLGATVCLCASRFARRPRATALTLVAAGTLLSLGGPLSLLGATQQDQPGVTDASALALLPLHVLVGLAVAIGIAGRLPRRR